MNVYFKDIILSGLRSFAEKYRSGELPSAMELPEECPAGNAGEAVLPDKG
jgi:hypothetical protein